MSEAEIKAVVKSAVAEALKDELRAANLIDGPTHIAHHQALSEFLSLTRHAKKTFVGAVIMGCIALLMLGIAVWRGQ